MIKLATELIKVFSFVRVDFYEIDGKVYFVEMTFTSTMGRDEFYPKEYDHIYADNIVLPKKKDVSIEKIKMICNK